MAITPPPSLTPAPTTPQRKVRATFSTLMDNFLTWLSGSVTQYGSLTQWMGDAASYIFGYASAAETAATDAANSAALAQAAATSNVAAADLTATSTSSVVLTTGIKSLTIQTGKKFQVNMPARLSNSASPGVYADGYIRSHDPATGAVSFQAQTISGSGTYTTWILMMTGKPGTNTPGGGGADVTYSGVRTDRFISNGDSTLVCFTVASGGAALLDDPIGVGGGYNWRELYNMTDDTYSNDLTIKDMNGNHIGYLAPNRTSPVHTRFNSDITAYEWVIPEATPVGKPLRLRATASARIGGANGTFVKMVQLDADRLLFLVYGISLHAVVYNQTTNQWGALTLIRSAWAGSGSADNVVGLLVATDTVMVASCPENTTTVQTVILSTSALSITPGTAQTTALSVAAARLLEIVTTGTSYILAYVTSANAIRLRAQTLSDTTLSTPGTEVAVTSTAAPAVLVGPSGTLVTVTLSASALTVTPVTASGTTLTAGTAVTRAATAAAGLTIRPVAASTLRWLITYINTTVQVTSLWFNSSTPTLTASTAVSSSVTTISNVQAVQYNFTLATAVTGTDASGGFVTDFAALQDSGSTTAPSLLSSIIPRYSPTVQTCGPLGHNNDNVASSATIEWMVSCSKGIELYSFVGTTLIFSTNKVFRIGPQSYAVALPVPANYPKQDLHLATLSKFATKKAAALGDGTKPALYTGNVLELGTMRSGVQLITDPLNGCKGTTPSDLWLAFSMGTDALLTLEQVRIA